MDDVRTRLEKEEHALHLARCRKYKEDREAHNGTMEVGPFELGELIEGLVAPELNLKALEKDLELAHELGEPIRLPLKFVRKLVEANDFHQRTAKRVWLRKNEAAKEAYKPKGDVRLTTNRYARQHTYVDADKYRPGTNWWSQGRQPNKNPADLSANELIAAMNGSTNDLHSYVASAQEETANRYAKIDGAKLTGNPYGQKPLDYSGTATKTTNVYHGKALDYIDEKGMFKLPDALRGDLVGCLNDKYNKAFQKQTDWEAKEALRTNPCQENKKDIGEVLSALEGTVPGWLFCLVRKMDDWKYDTEHSISSFEGTAKNLNFRLGTEGPEVGCSVILDCARKTEPFSSSTIRFHICMNYEDSPTSFRGIAEKGKTFKLNVNWPTKAGGKTSVGFSAEFLGASLYGDELVAHFSL